MPSGVTETNSSTIGFIAGPCLRRAPGDSGAPFEFQQPFLRRSRVSANNRSPQQPREPGVLEGKSGYCNRALVDRVSENHRQRPKAAQLASVGCPRLAGISSAVTRRDALSAIPARSDRAQGLASEPGALAVAPAARWSCLLPAALRASCQEPG
jgi:hypothetical protein